MARGRRAQRGMTLLELMISVAIFSAVIGMVCSLMADSQRYYQAATLDAVLQDNARAMTERIADEVVGGGILNPWMPYNADRVEFQKVVDLQNQEAVFGPLIRYWARLEANELDNNIDDDGDGLADEYELVRTEFAADGSTLHEDVVGRGITKHGVRFDMPTNKTMIIETKEGVDQLKAIREILDEGKVSITDFEVGRARDGVSMELRLGVKIFSPRYSDQLVADIGRLEGVKHVKWEVE